MPTICLKEGLILKRRDQSKAVELEHAGEDAVAAYSQSLSVEHQAICEVLREIIHKALPNATAKVWHGSPVWFFDPNPVVGYNATTNGVNLLFWNGQAFGDPNLKPIGKHRAAQASFELVDDIDRKALQGWLKKAKTDVLDSHGYFKKLRDEMKAKK
jgi:hypothetical protein